MRRRAAPRFYKYSASSRIAFFRTEPHHAAMTAAPPFCLRPAAARGRLVLWLAGLVFLFQLIAGTQHHHEPGAKTQHCVSCTLHAQPHAAPPDAVLAVVPATLTLLRVLGAAFSAHPAPSSPDHLRPPSQAPPSLPHRY